MVDLNKLDLNKLDLNTLNKLLSFKNNYDEFDDVEKLISFGAKFTYPEIKTRIFKKDTVFLHQRWQKTEMSSIPHLFWVSKDKFYYEENFPYYKVTINEDVIALDMEASGLCPHNLLVYRNRNDVMESLKYSQDSYAAAYLGFFKLNSSIGMIYSPNECIIYTPKVNIVLSSLII